MNGAIVDPISTLHSNILPYTAVLVGIGIALVAVFYMLSKFFENKKMEVWARQEAAQMALPFLLLIVLLLLEPLLAPMVHEIDPIRYGKLCGNAIVSDSMCHIVVGEAYLRSLTEETLDIQNNLLRMSFYLSLAKSMFSSAGQGVFAAAGVKITNTLVYAFTVPSLGMLRFVSGLVSTTMMVCGGFLALYRFLVFGFLPILTLGFLLRIVPASRQLGGLLIAIALASYYFFPFMLSVADAIYLSLPVAENNHYDTREYRISRFVPTGLDVYDFSGDFDDISNIFRDTPTGNPFESTLRDMDSTIGTVENRFTESGVDINSENVLTDPDSNSLVQATLKSMLVDVENTFSGKTITLALDMVSGAYTSLIMAAGFIFPNTAQGALTIDLTSRDGTQITKTHISPLVFVLVDELTNVWIFMGLVFYILAVAMIGAIKGLSPLLGGDVELAGLTRLI
jgi:hypothetical protein